MTIGRLPIFLLLAFSMMSCAGEPPQNLGVTDGKLTPCPDSPNCVSSQSRDEAHGVAPLTIRGTLSEAKQALKRILERLPRVRIVTETQTYLHAEFKIAIFGFIDDVELLFDEKENVIHIRSASRVGRWDLGVNRRRVEKLRRMFMAEQ